jgi:hypothetical protein
MSELNRKRIRFSAVAFLLLCAGYFLLSIPSTSSGKNPNTKTNLKDNVMADPDAEGDFQSPSNPEKPAEQPAATTQTQSPGMVTPEEPAAAPAKEDTKYLIPPKFGEEHKPEMSPEASILEDSKYNFGPDPVYESLKYDAEREIQIYKGKHAIHNSRPLLEWGRELYQYGPFQPLPDFTGSKNLFMGQFLMYGDWRTGFAYNDDGNNSFSRVATKLTLDLDLKLTSTERLHATFTPLDQDGEFSRIDTSGDFPQRGQIILDPDPDALFFEGDLGRILEGVTGKYNHLDIPFAGGIIPLLFQNGIWMQDAITGVAVTIPARNSPYFNISNMDITMFAGFDRVNTAAIPDENNARIFGFNAFLEANQGYWEVGYGYTEGQDQFKQFDYQNLAISFTKRYFGWLSNSLRFLASFGQDLNQNQETANGVLFIAENSLITEQPSTLVPYFNAFLGIDRPQSLARAGGAGGILQNTGINYETDGLTGFPKLDDTAGNTYGGALGIEYLFDLDQQIVFELAAESPLGVDNDPRRTAKGTQWGPGIRYQFPFANDWIMRFNLMAGFRNHQEDIFGIGFEIRNKF